MKKTDFAYCLETYLKIYLPGQIGLSENTIMAYRDTFIQILYFIENVKHKNPDKMTLSDFNVDLIEEFLSWLETEKNNSISTRNQRLAAIRAFSKYVRTKYPEFMFELQKILDMRRKRCPKPELIHLSPEEIKSILEAVPTITVYNRRDLTLLSLLYDSAARVQEICDLRVVDVRVKKPYIVKLTGKGQKTRCVPLMHNTIELLKKYIIPCRIERPKMSMWQLIPHKGFPMTRRVRYCCQYFKEGGGKNRMVATGVRWAESVKRKKRGIFEDSHSNIEKKIVLMNDNDDKRRLFERCEMKAKTICNPIIDFTTDEVLDFYKNECKYHNPIYDLGFKRCGCIGCPLASKARIKEFEIFPKYKQMYIRAFDRMLEVRKQRGLETRLPGRFLRDIDHSPGTALVFI